MNCFLGWHCRSICSLVIKCSGPNSSISAGKAYQTLHSISSVPGTNTRSQEFREKLSNGPQLKDFLKAEHVIPDQGSLLLTKDDEDIPYINKTNNRKIRQKGKYLNNIDTCWNSAVKYS